jgi:hypothetical protein
MRRVLTALLVCGLLGGSALAVVPERPGDSAPAQAITLDGLFTAYRDGDRDIVKRTFGRSRDFQAARIAQEGHLDRWLTPWHRGKAVMLLELAEASTRVAPQYTPFLLGAGRQYVRATREGNEPAGAGETFVRNWHRTAIGLLHRAGDPLKTEQYVEMLTAKMAGETTRPATDPRLLLAVAVAQEHRCWFTRPGLGLADAPIVEFTQAAGVRITDPLGPPPEQKERMALEYRDCLRLAINRFTEAAEIPETRAEARLRAGWTLFLAGHFQEALDRLDVGDVGDDRALLYWSALFRGRTLTALDRHQDAVDAYRSALELFPGAQSATVALALGLFRLNQVAEADELGRTLRTRPAPAEDPWPMYVEGEARFVESLIQQLRGSIR